MLTKICIKCKEEKDAAEFHKQAASKDGLCRWCKECTATYQNAPKFKETAATYKSSGRGRYARSKGSAKQRGIEFLFTFDEYVALITESERCYYCGRTEKESNDLTGFVRNYDGNDPKILKLKINLGGLAHSSTHFSIDRLDSFGPYSDENCVMSCALCNEAKGWMIGAKSWKKMANDVIDEITESCVDAGFDKES